MIATVLMIVFVCHRIKGLCMYVVLVITEKTKNM